MTTFAKVSEDVLPSISIDTDRVLSEIKDEVYSGFTEYVSSLRTHHFPLSSGNRTLFLHRSNQ